DSGTRMGPGATAYEPGGRPVRLTQQIIADQREAQCIRPERTKGIEVRRVQILPSPKTGATGRFFVTPYAVARYRERLRPRLSYQRALEELIVLTSAGRQVGPYLGRQLPQKFPGLRLEVWRGARVGPVRQQDRRARLRFVVAYGPGELPQVITVLSNGSCATKDGPRVATTRPGPTARGNGQSNDNFMCAAGASAQETACRS